jgi:nucleoside 2-deoxyribosyltransferase
VDIYVSCALTGGRQDQPLVAALVAHLEVRGHRVLTAHLAHPEAMAEDAGLSPQAVFARDTAWLRAADAVVAEVSTPSHGVGFEIAYALERGKPVLCCHRAEVRVSKMLTGNPSPLATLGAYRDAADLLAQVDAFLAAR